MDFKQIEAFIKVVELGSFSRAADDMFLSQPSISTYISMLEKELGETLLNRSTKEILPTLAGKIFYENAKELLALKHNTVERIRNFSGNFSGEINIIASSVPSQYILPEVLARFNALYPDVSFNVRQADTLEVSRVVAAQKAEVGFSGGIVENDKCEFKKIMSENMIFIAPFNSNFCSEKEYFLDELLYDNHFITRERGSGTRIEYENYFADENIDLNKLKSHISFDNTQSIINAVISGLGVSIVSEFAAKAFINQGLIKQIKLKKELPKRSFYYVLKKNFSHSHLIDLFTTFLVDSHKNDF